MAWLGNTFIPENETLLLERIWENNWRGMKLAFPDDVPEYCQLTDWLDKTDIGYDAYYDTLVDYATDLLLERAGQ